MTKNKAADVATKIVDLLAPLESEERRRAVRAALTLVGETQDAAQSGTQVEDPGSEGQPKNLQLRVRTWMRQYGIEWSQLEQLFHIENGNVEVIASQSPGKSSKEQTLNAYVLEGLGRFIATGDSGFDDKSARQLCEQSGCYNSANHAVYMKNKGNKFTGSKEQGWKLTAPGLAHGAALVKELTGGLK